MIFGKVNELLAHVSKEDIVSHTLRLMTKYNNLDIDKDTERKIIETLDFVLQQLIALAPEEPEASPCVITVEHYQFDETTASEGKEAYDIFIVDNDELEYPVDFVNWSELLDMDLSSDYYNEIDSLCLLIMEMTLYGETPEEIQDTLLQIHTALQERPKDLRNKNFEGKIEHGYETFN